MPTAGLPSPLEKNAVLGHPRLGRPGSAPSPQLLGSYSHYRCPISSVPGPHMSTPRHQSPTCSSELPRLQWAL